MRAVALGRDLDSWEIVAVREKTSFELPDARREAFGRVRRGDADVWMDTGSLDAEFFPLLEPVADKGRVLSYASVTAAPRDGRLMILSDTLIHESPSIREKIGIVGRPEAGPVSRRKRSNLRRHSVNPVKRLKTDPCTQPISFINHCDHR